MYLEGLLRGHIQDRLETEMWSMCLGPKRMVKAEEDENRVQPKCLGKQLAQSYSSLRARRANMSCPALQRPWKSISTQPQLIWKEGGTWHTAPSRAGTQEAFLWKTQTLHQHWGNTTSSKPLGQKHQLHHTLSSSVSSTNTHGMDQCPTQASGLVRFCEHWHASGNLLAQN